MGRRNINTTKSGKYMNPTDQARKEARKKELKKNKRQRQMVRTAVLKGKDPTQLIIEMEKMDQMEYNVEIPPALSEKVLKDKRKKLRETLDRVMKLYEKENPEYWVEIRRMMADYEKKRSALIEYYEAVKHAQAVTVDEIPLPNLDMPPPEDGISIQMPGTDLSSLPPQPSIDGSTLPHSILKKHHLLPQQPPVPGEEFPSVTLQQHKLPPGCPPTLPIELSDDEEDYDMPHQKAKKIRFEDENETEMGEEGKENDAKAEDAAKSGVITSLQAKLLQLSGQDVDQFVREAEVLLQEKEADKNADLQKRLARLKDSTSLDENTAPGEENDGNTESSAHQGSLFPMRPPVGVAPVPVPPPQIPPMFRPPPPRPGLLPPLSVRLPAGPPPQGLGQMVPGSQGHPRLPNMRLPPPVRSIAPPSGPPHPLPPSAHSNVLSAGPQLVSVASKPTATIQAKPQIRSLSADVTRFLPTSLRVKREDKKKGSKTDGKEGLPRMDERENKKPTKEDAYSQFMQEMEDLM